MTRPSPAMLAAQAEVDRTRAGLREVESLLAGALASARPDLDQRAAAAAVKRDPEWIARNDAYRRARARLEQERDRDAAQRARTHR